jgi:hypothetical protein
LSPASQLAGALKSPGGNLAGALQSIAEGDE